jgi:hypothetical protein
MSNFFNPKAFTFYGGSVIAVITLFSVATTYGETNLEAPRRIDGRYSLLAEGLPDCLQAKPLILQLHQSGKYLTGALLPADATENMIRMGEERPSLVGQWRQPQITLQGNRNSLPNCQDQVVIEGEITQEPVSGQPISGSLVYGNQIISGAVVPSQKEGAQDILKGTLRIGSVSTGIPFSTKREASPHTTQEH